MKLEQRLKIAQRQAIYRQNKIPKIQKNILDDDLIIGLMLSDGHISRQRTIYSNSNFSISVGSKYEKFASYIESYLKGLGTIVYKKDNSKKLSFDTKNYRLVVYG